jgi:hypothetical protein
MSGADVGMSPSTSGRESRGLARLPFMLRVAVAVAVPAHAVGVARREGVGFPHTVAYSEPDAEAQEAPAQGARRAHLIASRQPVVSGQFGVWRRGADR